ncbi:MAG: aminotransferase class III-fold pyridoxal phosphate-dependent enzyme [Bacteroidota bacterium]
MQYVEGEGPLRQLRIQTWVDGHLLDHVNPLDARLLRQWGRLGGQLSKALQNFQHPAAQRAYVWDPSRTLAGREYLSLFTDEQRDLATYFWDGFAQRTLPILPNLRRSVNYNDAHAENILVTYENKIPNITGLIDFGDVLYTQTVNEIAIACAYGAMHQPEPLRAAAEMVGAYHEVFPLEEREVAQLYWLIAARLLITTAQAAKNRQTKPENNYLFVSEQPAWELLANWRSIAPAFAEQTFRAACGWAACPQRVNYDNWLATGPAFAPLLGPQERAYTPMDLSVGSLDLGSTVSFETIQPFTATIDRLLTEKQADVGVGGYLETRPVYTTDAYQFIGNEGVQWRTVHLGLDLWTAAGQPVRAPLAGTVHSLQNNAAERDYGPTLLLRHQPTDDLTFYTLYGHLGTAVLDQWRVGDQVAAGQAIATIGPAPENGNWPPHLHFQIILDLYDQTGDFPGVAFPHEQAVWQSNCPDPGAWYPHLPHQHSEQLDAETLLAKRKKYLGRSLSLSYQEPLHIQRGAGCYLYASDGRRYLDTANNVAHVGHEHPQVVRAGQRQMAVLNTNTRYLNAQMMQYAEELLATFPPELCVVHFVNSGSEANELALRMARTCTGRPSILAVEAGYHGNTNETINVSSYKFSGKGGQGQPVGTQLVPIPDVYRGAFRDATTAGAQYAAEVGQLLQKLADQEVLPAAFLHESILSCGGQIVLPAGYLEMVYQQVRQHGGLCIADEVQVGFGRVGSHFWAFETQQVVPDIVTLGKPIGNGHPLGAVVCTEAVAEGFANGMEYFNTFGGNPVSCAIGRAVLRVIEQENLQENALRVGQYLQRALGQLQAECPIIGDVRGLGLFLGIELVSDRQTRAPAAAEARYLVNRMRQFGILMSTDGPLQNVIKIKPPICFSETQADFLLDNLRRVLWEDFIRPSV